MGERYLAERTYSRKTFSRNDKRPKDKLAKEKWPTHTGSSGYLAETTFDQQLHFVRKPQNDRNMGNKQLIVLILHFLKIYYLYMFIFCMSRIPMIIKQECVQTTHCYIVIWTTKVFAEILNS